MEELRQGVYLMTSEELMEDQESWSDFDQSKTVDFSTYDYWVVSDSGADPEGFDCPQDAFRGFE